MIEVYGQFSESDIGTKIEVTEQILPHGRVEYVEGSFQSNWNNVIRSPIGTFFVVKLSGGEDEFEEVYDEYTGEYVKTGRTVTRYRYAHLERA